MAADDRVDLPINPAGFRSSVLRAVRAQFPLKLGRPTDPRLDAACRLVLEGKTVPEVLRAQIPGWETLDRYTRILASKGLHQAVARRRRGRPERQAEERKR